MTSDRPEVLQPSKPPALDAAFTNPGPVLRWPRGVSGSAAGYRAGSLSRARIARNGVAAERWCRAKVAWVAEDWAKKLVFAAGGIMSVEPSRQPHRRPLTRHDSEVAQQMVERAAQLARDSRARTRHAAVLVKDDGLLAWGTNGVPFPGEDHCYCKVGEFGHHDHCRTHAEQRAINLTRQGDGWRKLPGSMLVYVRLEADDSVRLADPHFCARCARLALSLGVSQWIFALSDGLAGYSATDYDQIAQLRW